MSFCARNFGAFLLAQVIVGLMFAAIFTDWYSWTTNYTQKGGTVNSNALQGVTNTLTLNYSNIYFNTTGFRTIIRTSAQTTANVAAVTVYSTWGNTNGAYSKVRSFIRIVPCIRFTISLLRRWPHFSIWCWLSPSSPSSSPASSPSTFCSYFFLPVEIITSKHAECPPCVGCFADLCSASGRPTSSHSLVFLVSLPRFLPISLRLVTTAPAAYTAAQPQRSLVTAL